MHFLTLSILLILASCSPTTKVPSKGKLQGQLKDTSKTTETETGSDLLPEPKPRQKVNGAKLRVTDISIGKMLEGGKRAEVVDFSASGQTEYVLWQMCPQEEILNQTAKCVPSEDQVCGPGGGACVQNVTPYNKILFPRLFAGKVIFSIKACVDPESAMDPNQACGEFTDLEYDSHVTDSQVTSLFAKRQSLIDALNRLGEEKKELFVLYRNDLMGCLKFDAAHAALYQSKIRAINGLIDGVFFKMWVWGPKALIEEMDKTAGGHAILEAARTVISGIKSVMVDLKNAICGIGTTTGIDTNCLTSLKDSSTTMTEAQQNSFCRNQNPDLGTIGKLCGIVGQVVSAMGGTLSMMNPGHSIGILSNALHDVSDPENAVSRQCMAEQKLAKPSEQVDKSAVLLTEQLIQVNNQLRALGEL